METIKQSVNDTLHQGFEIPLESLKPEANLFTDLKLDSLDAIDMIVYLEEKLGVKVEGDVFKEVRTLNDVYTMISRLTPESKVLN